MAPTRNYPMCKNSTRYNRTRNFGLYGHAESKKTQKFVFRSALRPNQISFSHSQDPHRTSKSPKAPTRKLGRTFGSGKWLVGVADMKDAPDVDEFACQMMAAKPPSSP